MENKLAHKRVPWRIVLMDWGKMLGVAWRVLAHAPGISITIFLGTVSVLLGLIALKNPDPGWFSYARYGFITLCLLFLTMGLTYKFARPEQFAAAAVVGQSATSILQFISAEIERVCQCFLTEARKTHHLISSGEQRRKEPRRGLGKLLTNLHNRRVRRLERKKPARIRASIERLTDLLEKHRKAFLRLHALKAAAAIELGVSSRRLCDHIFRFSPIIFEQGARRYLADWRLIERAFLSGEFKSRPQHIDRLVNDLEAITDSCRQRIGFQVQLRRMWRLHEEVILLASSRSTSGSLMEYALTLAKIVDSQVETRPDAGGMKVPPARDQMLVVKEKLEYIYKKQRVHAGFDLHSLLIKLCRRVRKDQTGVSNSRRTNRQILLLQAIDQSPTSDATWFPHPGEVRELLEALWLLPLTILQHEYEAEKAISDRLHNYCRKQSEDCQGITFLVTTGYSRTVLAAIAKSLSTGGTRGFLVTGNHPEQLSARQMKSELRLQAASTHILRRIASGPSEMLLGLLEPNDRVLLIFGAEVFEGERIAHPHLSSDQLRSLEEEVKKRKIDVELVAVAAAYKSIGSRMATSPLFVDQFDGITILETPTVFSEANGP